MIEKLFLLLLLLAASAAVAEISCQTSSSGPFTPNPTLAIPPYDFPVCADLVTLLASRSCSGFLVNDGTCPTSSGAGSADSGSSLQTNGGSGLFGATANVASGSPRAPQGSSTTPVFQLKPVIDVRDTPGVDCTGATASDAALNALTNTPGTLSSKTLSFRSCPLVQLDHQWLIFGQEHLEIDLGNTINTMTSAGPQGNTIIFGCNGAAGSLVLINRSGYTNIHGGAIVAKGNSCGSNFTGSIQYTNRGPGGYTSTENTLADIWLTSNNQGTAISAYSGVQITGTPNQEEYRLRNVHINCQNSTSSYGVWQTDINADSTSFTFGEIDNCYSAVRNDGGNIRITYSDLGSDGNYSVFGSGGAVLTGPVEEFSNNVVDSAGNLQIPNSGGGSGGTFGWNQFGMFDLDPNHYYFENSGSGIIVFLGNNIFNASAVPKSDVLIGSTTYSTGNIYNLGSIQINNVAAPSCCGFYNQSTTQGSLFSTGFLSGVSANSYIGGTTTGFSLMPAANIGNNERYSAHLDFQSDIVGPYGTFSPPNLDDYRWRSLTSENGKWSTLALAYTPASGSTAAGSLAIGVPLAGINTILAATPVIDIVQPVGTTGSTAYSYVAVSRSGCGTSSASRVTTITNGNASLSTRNYNLIALYLVSGAWGYDIYRTAGGTSQGLIGTTAIVTDPNFRNNGDITFLDTGLVGHGATAPTMNTSGCIATSGQVISKVATGTAPFSVASTTPVANLTLTEHPQVYEAGVLTVSEKIYTNTQALSTGVATHTFANRFAYTSSSTFGCTCTDQTAANACRAVPATATTVTLTGTGSDVLWVSCSGH